MTEIDQYRDKLDTSDSQSDYHIDCTGDVVAGDHIQFDQKMNQRWNASIKAVVLDDFYDKWHIFILLLKNGSITRKRASTVYRFKTMRKMWKNEDNRQKALDEKHVRGRAYRKGLAEKMFERRRLKACVK